MLDDAAVLLPPLGGDDMESATFVNWLVETGSSVAEGEAIAHVETAKATIEVVAPVAGFLIRGEARPGDEIPLRSVLARIVKVQPTVGAAENVGPVRSPPEPEDRDSTPTSPRPVTARATPSARRLARARGVDLSAIKLAGETILESDVEHYLGNSQIPGEADRTHAGGGYRRSMARAMAESAGIPQFNVAVDCDGEALVAERQRLAHTGMHFSVNDLVLQHVALALARHPRMRMYWDGTTPKLAAEINIAVAMETPYGLVAPVIRSVDVRSLEELAAEVRRLKSLAFEQRLGMEDVSGASFSVSNLGGVGVDDFTALVSAGQGAILAVSSFKPWPSSKADGSIAWCARARFRVSADHRVITGLDVAEFLRDLRALIEAR
jgi:pyruvate/2-oxoglutarate dehydrogenase complex dihydrolipoamide acyltransferase (E2) component